MTVQQMKEVFAYRRTMQGYLDSGYVMDGADDWIRMELHNQDRELRSQVAAELRGERQTEKPAEIKRPAGRGESKLRSRLKQLISAILPRMEAERNGYSFQRHR